MNRVVNILCGTTVSELLVFNVIVVVLMVETISSLVVFCVLADLSRVMIMKL